MFKRMTVRLYVKTFEQLENFLKKTKELQKEYRNIEIFIDLNDKEL